MRKQSITSLRLPKRLEESQNIAAASLFNSFNEELAKPKTGNKIKVNCVQFWDGLVKFLPDIANIGKSVCRYSCLVFKIKALF